MDGVRQFVDLLATADLNTAEALALAAVTITVLTILARSARRLHLPRFASVATAAANVVILGTTIEGAMRLAERLLHVDGVERIFPAILFETIAVNIFFKARQHAAAYHHGPGRWTGRLYLIGAVAGGIVATSGTSIGECAFRFVAPLVGVWLIVLDLTPDQDDQAADTSSWRWTPRRFGIWIGAIKAGANDADTVVRELRVATLTRTAHRMNTSNRLLRRYHRSRLQRLALTTTDDTVADAEANILRADTITDRLNPAAITAARQAADTTAQAAALHAETTARQAADAQAHHARQAADEAANLAAHEAEIAAGYRQETEDTKRQLTQAQAAAHHAAAQRNAAEAHAADTRRELDTLRADYDRIVAANTELQAAAHRHDRPHTISGSRPLLPVVDGVTPATVAKVLIAWAGKPTGTQTEIAKAAGVGERTVRTVLAALRTAPTTHPPATPGTGTRQLITASGDGTQPPGATS